MRRVGVLIWGTVVVLLGLVLASASGGTATPPPAQPDRLNLSVVAIDAQIGGDRVRSSGTVVDARDGLVVTSAHSVWGATSLKVATALGVLHGRIVARAPCDDLALVETQPRIPGLVALEAAPGTRTSELVTAVGRRRLDPDAGAGSLLTIPARATATGAAAQFDPLLEPLQNAVRLDGRLVPESSGGPIVDRAGRIVAMATLTDDGAADTAVRWTAVRDRLDQLERGERSAYVGWHGQYRCSERLHAYAEQDHPGYRRSDARLNAPVPATRLPGTEGLDE